MSGFTIEVYNNGNWDRQIGSRPYYPVFTDYLQMIAAASCDTALRRFRIVETESGIVYDEHKNKYTPAEVMQNWRTRDLQALVANVEKPKNSFVIAAKGILESRGRLIPASYDEYYGSPVFAESRRVRDSDYG